MPGASSTPCIPGISGSGNSSVPVHTGRGPSQEEERYVAAQLSCRAASARRGDGAGRPAPAAPAGPPPRRWIRRPAPRPSDALSEPKSRPVRLRAWHRAPARAARETRLSGISERSSNAMSVAPSGVKATSSLSASEIVWKIVRSSWKPSGRFPRTRRSRLILASAGTRAWRADTHLSYWISEKMSLPFSFSRPLRKVSSTTKAEAHDDAARLAHHACRRGGGSSGRQQIVHDQDALPGNDGVTMHLQGVGAVLQVVADAHTFRRQLLRLADRHKARALRP